MNKPDGGQIEFVELKDIKPRSRLIKGGVLNPDACNHIEPDNLVDASNVTFDFRDVPSSTITPSLSIEAGSKWSNEATVKLEKMGLELGTKYECTVKYSMELEYTLVQGYTYTAVKPSDSVYWLWLWKR